MGREINRLSARKVQTLAEPGRHADGGGLYLVVDPSGAKRWVFLFRMKGKRREMGLGSTQAVPLARARDMATEARGLVAEDIDPVERKQAARAVVEPAAPILFSDVAIAFMADREGTWRNAKHRAQWRSTLENQAGTIWGMAAEAVETKDVLAALRPIWASKPETAQRLRGRIEAVLDAAKVAGVRTGENPARWRGHLDKLLPRGKKLARGHHPAMPYADLPGFYARLVTKSGFSAMALRLAILTAARSGEVRGMAWGEIDMRIAVWTVPAERMKADREHRVPLCPAVMALLSDLRPDEPSPEALVLPSRVGTPLSDMALTMLMRKAKLGMYTVHGFRSSFRQWVDEATDYDGNVAEAALAHLTGDETERAYRRGDALAKRTIMMNHWAAFVTSGVPAR